ncbi:MAG: hypothetical protein VXW11_07060, partial [Pseudomonadota bacterium]|nr:hypothetical protein [Pseudomonadota bacterium]
MLHQTVFNFGWAYPVTRASDHIIITSNKGEKAIDTNILKTQERIERILGLKVNILNKKNNSGKVTIEYK